MKSNNIVKPCGGKGICGKCKIKVISGNITPNERDRKFLTDKEIKEGFRIACGHNINDNIEFISISEKFDAVSEYRNINKNINKNIINNNIVNSIIIDVGTTTLCFQLLDNNGNIIKTITKSNSQRIFGADIISRISKAIAGGLLYLQDMLKNDIKKGIISLCEKQEILPENIYIAGNTAITYFLRGLDCRDLGSYPFNNRAKDIFTQEISEFFGENLFFSAKVIILPCISAFIGGDILSGAYFLNFKEEYSSIFIDIGTNSEMLLNAKGKLYASSAAAGPAFEGGSISCAIGGIEGAINKIKYENNIFKYKTIGNKKPIGICGSALIDLIAELLENKIIDNTGLLIDKYFSKGIEIENEIILKQDDIRQVQLAKSAIKSGIESMIEYSGIKLSDIKKVFIGGGFGFFLDSYSAIKIKMLPEEFSDKIIYCGNTCLGGLSKIHKINSNYNFTEIISEIKSIDLAALENFQSLFIENINF